MSRFVKLLTPLCVFALVSCADQQTATEPNISPLFAHVDGTVLLDGQIPASDTKVEKVIGPGGGVIWIAGGVKDGRLAFHSLTVPPGVIREPLLFTMELVPNIVAVDLKAHRVKNGMRGEEVGHLGFPRPLYLTLSYAWADQDLVNTHQLGIVYVVGNVIRERVNTTRAPWSRLLVGEIRHFSRYSASVQ